MIDIFYLDNGKPFPTDEALLLEPIKAIWRRDKNKGKSMARKELAYVWYRVAPVKNNPFKDLPEDMWREIADALKLPSTWAPDEVVQEAVKFLDLTYKDMWEPYALWRDMVETSQKLRRFLKTIDMNERTDRGFLVHKPSEIAMAVSRNADNIDKLIKLESSLYKAIEEGRARKRELTNLNDPEFMKKLASDG